MSLLSYSLFIYPFSALVPFAGGLIYLELKNCYTMLTKEKKYKSLDINLRNMCNLGMLMSIFLSCYVLTYKKPLIPSILDNYV